MSDYLDLQGAKDLNTDAIHLGAVANSKDPVTGEAIDTHVNRSGGTDYTVQGFWNALQLQFGDQLSNLQPWATAPTQDEAQTALGMSASGKTVATGTPAQGRTALGLGSRTISASGDGSWSVSFDGTANVTSALTLANSGVTAGTYGKVTVDAKGRVTAGTALAATDIPALDWSKITTGKPTTLAGYGITNAQPLDATLTALAGVATAADRIIYFTGVDVAAQTPLTAFGRSLIDDADASTALTTLGVSAFAKTLLDDADAATAWGTLALGTAATKNVGTSSGNVMEVGAGGWLGASGNDTYGPGYPATVERNASQIYRRTNDDIGGVSAFAASIHFAASNTWGRLRTDYGSPRAWVQGGAVSGNPWSAELRHTGNTTVDSNGFLKNASPIIKLHSDRMETEADGAFERLGTGHYRITGCNGLRLGDGWYIETPHDRNGNKYFNVEWEQDHEPENEEGVLDEPADVTLTVRCYERVWNPQTGTYDNGNPVDIPEGRWIDLRMNEVRQPEIEMDASNERADSDWPAGH